MLTMLTILPKELHNDAQLTNNCEKGEKLSDSICQKCKRLTHGESFTFQTHKLALNVCQHCAKILYFSPIEKYWRSKSEQNTDQEQCNQCHRIPNRLATLMIILSRTDSCLINGNQEDSITSFNIKRFCFGCLKKYYQCHKISQSD